MTKLQLHGEVNGHIVGRVLKEAVRRAVSAIHNERASFEATIKESYGGTMYLHLPTQKHRRSISARSKNVFLTTESLQKKMNSLSILKTDVLLFLLSTRSMEQKHMCVANHMVSPQ